MTKPTSIYNIIEKGLIMAIFDDENQKKEGGSSTPFGRSTTSRSTLDTKEGSIVIEDSFQIVFN